MLKLLVPVVRSSGLVVFKRPLATATAELVNPTKTAGVNCPETKITTLKSGFRVASQFTPHNTATVGVYIDAGSRYETAKNNGVAHFLEHMAFKGTKKRSQLNLELEVEHIGAHLNAYTSREHTIYYAKCLSGDLERAVEILSDLLLNSVYGEGEMKREKDVIIRESEEIDQNMQELVFDRLHADVYRDCSLGRTILGSINNIKQMRRTDLVDYVKTYYKGPRMVLAAAGGFDHQYLVDLGEKYFGNIERGSDSVLEYEPAVFREGCHITNKPDKELVYGCLTVEGTSWTHPMSFAMQVANGLTGQFDRTQSAGIIAPTDLALKMERDTGVESYLTFTTNYKDTGLTGIYFSCKPHGLPVIIEEACREWRKYSEDVDERKLSRSKHGLYNNMCVMLDGTTPVCEDIGRQLLCYNRRMSMLEAKARIDAVTPDTIRQVFNDFFLNKPVGLNLIGPADRCPSFDQIKQWLTK